MLQGVNIIIACDENRGFGNSSSNTLPWGKISEDLKRFRQLTSTGTMIMGRKTWESLPEAVKNDSNRHKLVISRSLPKGRIGNYNAYACSSLSFPFLTGTEYWIIGGVELIKTIFQDLHQVNKIYLTKIKGKYSCDIFLPEFPPYFVPVETEAFSVGEFVTYENRSETLSQERFYLSLLKDILINGESRPDRTGIGTLSVFGRQLRFDLSEGFPLLTTKRVFFRGVVEELLFFLRGDHDNRKLQAVGVKIWNGNTSREYLDQYRPHLETNDLGKSYPIQWRASGAPLMKIDESYIGKGVDQISQIIDLLKNDPYSRRIILNAWNVSDLKDMALVPCHMLYQFYVSIRRNKKILNCMMIQRSADMFLGLPFNIASTSLLTHILANICDMDVGEITINIGDAHIYQNHLEQVQEQLKRLPIKFPNISINKKLNNIEDIENLQFQDFQLNNYHCWPTIKADMAV